MSYSEVPPGGQINIPPAIPSGMLYRVKQIMGISKQTLKLVPLSGQTLVTNGGKIIVALPPNSLVDLSTFELNFRGYTQHGGNGSTWANTAGTSTNLNTYVNKRYFPRNIASLIENLEIKINGQSRQNINQYGYIYNILNDFTCGYDTTAKNRIGQNADPSNKTTNNNAQLQAYRGFPVGCTAQSGDNSHLDQDFYTIRQWLGILGGNASTSIIDTSLYGDVVIELTLAPAGVLMLSPPLGAFTSVGASVTNPELNLSIAQTSTVAALAAQGTGYTLDNIGFQITRYDMPSTYYSAVASVLEGGAIFKLYYPNYSTFLGINQSLPKGGTTRFNISTQSLDMVISTFQVQDRDTQQAPILGQANANGWGTSPGDTPLVGASTTGSAGEFGTHTKSFNYALQLGVAKTLNNSKYFVRNGDGIDRCTYIVGAVRLIPETIQEQFNGVLRAFGNSQVDTLGGCYPGIQSLYHYQSQFYSHVLSLNVTTEHDVYTVSGLNCSATPISIGWEVTGSASTAVANYERQATSNGNIWQTSNLNSTPIMIACYTSRLEVSVGRNIITIT